MSETLPKVDPQRLFRELEKGCPLCGAAHRSTTAETDTYHVIAYDCRTQVAVCSINGESYARASCIRPLNSKLSVIERRLARPRRAA